MRARPFIAVLLFVLSQGCGDRASLVQESTATLDVEAAKDSPTTEADSDNLENTSIETGAKVPSVATTVAGRPNADKVQVISFDDLNIGMGEDARFRPMMLDYNDGRSKELLGLQINVGGHMNPPDQLRGLKEFVLLKNKDCKFGPGGQADHLLRVFMKEGTTVDYTDKVIYVEGRLSLKPFPDDSPLTWSIYDVEATNVSTRPPSRSR